MSGRGARAPAVARATGRVGGGSPILAHVFEPGFPKQVVFRQCAAGDLGLDHRLDPRRFRLVDRLGSGMSLRTNGSSRSIDPCLRIAWPVILVDRI
jgi:hypothetical protein